MTIFEAFRRVMRGLLAVVVLGIVTVGLFVGYCAFTLPLSRQLVGEVPPAAIVYTASAGQPLAVRGAYRGERLTADRLPPDLVHAVVAIEDQRFGNLELRCRGQSAIRGGIGAIAAAGIGVDDSAAGVDSPHSIVVGIGDVDVPRAVDGQSLRSVELRRRGRGSVA